MTTALPGCSPFKSSVAWHYSTIRPRVEKEKRKRGCFLKSVEESLVECKKRVKESKGNGTGEEGG